MLRASVLILSLAIVACTGAGQDRAPVVFGSDGAAANVDAADGNDHDDDANAAAGVDADADTDADASADADADVDRARDDGSSEHGESSGLVTAAGCANHHYQVCLDFEDGIDSKTWTSGNTQNVVTGNAAHGLRAYHAYPGGGLLKTTQVGAIKTVIWGRFYLRMSPGAPGGHGELVGAYDVSGDWYEVGWQFNGILGNWHGLGGEKPLRSMPTIVDRWYCVEYLFDGARGVMPQWWIDGQEAQYYMPVPAAKGPRIETQFTRLEVGFTSFAGLGLDQVPYGNNNPPVLTDVWIDDVAFDTQRIGCIE